MLPSAFPRAGSPNPGLFPRENGAPESDLDWTTVTAASPAPERRRSRPGSLDRPDQRAPLPRHLAPRRPAAPAARVQRLAAAGAHAATEPAAGVRRGAEPRPLARDLASNYPDRRPGTPGRQRSRGVVPASNSTPYGFNVRQRTVHRDVNGRRTTLVNLVAEEGLGLSPPRDHRHGAPRRQRHRQRA